MIGVLAQGGGWEHHISIGRSTNNMHLLLLDEYQMLDEAVWLI